MEICTIPFEKVPHFSFKDIAYATGHPGLLPFYKYKVSLESFAQVITDKKNDPTNRTVLVQVLKEQYRNLDPFPAVLNNIESLAGENTFTVTTAHQPALFTGPLYYIYKIISTLNLAKTLSRTYPDYRFVPVFVNGAEDHDFEEVNHANMFNKQLVWESGETGSVGMMKTHSLQPLLDQLREILGTSENSGQLFHIIEKAYTTHQTYAEATQELVHELFKSSGLVILNMNHPDLKRLFIPIMRQELLKQPSQSFIESAQAELNAAGFSGQAHAREINLFYLRDQIRSRIVKENGRYRVMNTDFIFSEQELLDELEAHPEHFSPNVVLRPLYQELILPNLAYVGGGGEIAYWLERKKQFGFFGINFPMLIRRNSVLWIDGGTSKRMEKLGLNVEDLLEETEELIKAYVKKNTEKEISLTEEKQQIQEIFLRVKEKAQEIDPTLVKTTLAEEAKQLNSMEQLEAKLMRAEKQRHETAIAQIRSLKEKLFPGNGLQERFDNFAPFYLKYGTSFFDILAEHLHPLQPGLVVILDR